MKVFVATLNVYELQQLVATLKSYAMGAQLQDIALNKNYLLLQHHLKGPLTVGLEIRPLRPRLGYFFGEIPKSKYLVKPIVLFLRAHAKNLRLVDITMDLHWGRVVQFWYSGSEGRECHIEFRSIPHGVNIIIKAQGKSISLFPVKDLVPSQFSLDGTEAPFDENVYLDEWMNAFLGKATPQSPVSLIEEQEKKRKKEIHKKEMLIEKLTQDLSSFNKPWLQVGEYLKSQQTLEVPDDWSTLIDVNLSLSSNMQICFAQYKKQEERREQVVGRLHQLQLEIQGLQQSFEKEGVEPSLNLNYLSPPSVRSLAGELLSKAKARGRKLKLADEIEAVFGKSAKDNLAILRKAQAWDLWLHLKDLPGAHLIIRRPKHKSVDQTYLLEAARWLLNETLGKKKVIEGDRYEILVAECRYVKPIKGDRLGRVSYQNEKSLRLRV